MQVQSFQMKEKDRIYILSLTGPVCRWSGTGMPVFECNGYYFDRWALIADRYAGVA